MTVIADTGALFALLDEDDAWHARVSEWWRSNTSEVLIPVTVLPELAYLLATRIGSAAEEGFFRSVAAGELVVEGLKGPDYARLVDVMRKYGDARLGFVDASIVALAERFTARRILTTDRRHFTAVRPRHARAFELVP